MSRPPYAAQLALPLALLAPLCPWWGWAILAPLLAWTGSWLAFCAVGAAMVWLHPWTLAWALLGALGVALLWALPGRPLEWTPRGDSLDSVVGRWNGLRCALTRLTWRGHGRGSMARDLKRWTSRGVRYLPSDYLLCEPVQVVYEYGLLGLVALTVAAVLGFLSLAQAGPPNVAVGVALTVLSLGHAPLRVLWRRCRAVFPTPPLLAEVTIHVAHDGTFKLHTPISVDASPELVEAVASAIVRAGVHFGESRGLTLLQFGDFERAN